MARWWNPRSWRRTERRDTSYTPSYGLGWSSSGTIVNARMAENLATVVACVNAIATGLSSLPACVYRVTDAGREESPNHPVARLIRQPNARQTWPDFIETVVGQVLLHGNAIAVLEYDGAGRPTGLIPVPWPNVIPVLLPSGRLAFDVVAYTAPWGGSGTPRRFLDSEVFHLKDRSDDGWLGRSRIGRAPDVLGAAVGLQTYSRAVWENAATPSGALEVPPNISPEGMKRLESFIADKYTGAHNGRRVMLVDSGTKWTTLSVAPEDAEVLDSRRFTVAELCRLFQVPPPLVQDYSHSTFTNAAQADLWFARTSLQPWARKIEAEFARTVFNDPTGRFHLEIDFSAMTRGDYATRWTANIAAVNAGILTRDEVREQEGYGPLPGGATQDAPPADPTEGDN